MVDGMWNRPRYHENLLISQRRECHRLRLLAEESVVSNGVHRRGKIDGTSLIRESTRDGNCVADLSLHLRTHQLELSTHVGNSVRKVRQQRQAHVGGLVTRPGNHQMHRLFDGERSALLRELRMEVITRQREGAPIAAKKGARGGELVVETQLARLYLLQYCEHDVQFDGARRVVPPLLAARG